MVEKRKHKKGGAERFRAPKKGEKPEKLPNRVREWRNVRGMTLQDVFDLTGLNRSEVSKIELGRRGVARPDKLVKLAAAFKVPPAELIWPEDHDEVFRNFPVDPYAVPRLPGSDRDRDSALPFHPSTNMGGPLASVPILGMVANGKLTAMAEEVGRLSVQLPGGLMKGAYAVYNPTSEFSGVKPGDMLVVTPAMPPKPGDLVIVRRDEAAEIVLLDKPISGHVVVHKIGAVLPC